VFMKEMPVRGFAPKAAGKAAGGGRRRLELFAAVVSGAIALGIAAQAVGAEGKAEIPVVAKPGLRLVHAAAVSDYTAAYRKAKEAGVAPKRNLAKDAHATTAKLRHQTRELTRNAAAGSTTGTSGAGSPAKYGVSQSTLDSIAACESGGDPTAVSPDGTYRGKYQFDMQTWASMGGSGDPAAAPEAEQDALAAKLYASSGSSPWPICG
jgi:soluble lytic murein transglycosylase-like protein